MPSAAHPRQCFGRQRRCYGRRRRSPVGWRPTHSTRWRTAWAPRGHGLRTFAHRALTALPGLRFLEGSLLLVYRAIRPALCVEPPRVCGQGCARPSARLAPPGVFAVMCRTRLVGYLRGAMRQWSQAQAAARETMKHVRTAGSTSPVRTTAFRFYDAEWMMCGTVPVPVC